MSPSRAPTRQSRPSASASAPSISTFGLINRGKGLEYAIEAMRDVVKRHPEALYLILGETHPVVRRHEGESYRESLQAYVREFGLKYNVQLVDKYLAFDEVVAYLAATDIYLTPYLNPAQIVSGTLAYAVGCGKAIVSTPYLYARRAAGAQSRFLVRVSRRPDPSRGSSTCCSTIRRSAARPSGARIASAVR